MAFPLQGIIDAFTRADEDPLSDGGKYERSGDCTDDLRVLSNQAAAGSATWCGNHRADARYTGVVEVYAAVSVLSGADDAEVRLLSTPSGPISGYNLIYDVSGTARWRLFRRDAGGQTQLGSTFVEDLLAGDSMGLEMNAGTLTVYRKTGGVWSSKFTHSDPTYSGPFSLGILAQNTVIRLDDFGGGGTVYVAPPAVPSRRGLTRMRGFARV